MSVTIRQAEAADRTRCLELLQDLSAATGGVMDPAAGRVFERLLDGERGRVLVAEEDGALLGLASISFNLAMRYGGEYCQLEELIVDPGARGKNVGGLLVAATLERARERGCVEYGLYLVPATEQNWPFYRKYGFEKAGTELRQRLS